MQGTINSYKNGYYSKFEYSITPLNLQNKAKVYMKLTLVSTNSEDMTIQSINEQFCTLNSMSLFFNSLTDNNNIYDYSKVPVAYPSAYKYYGLNDKINIVCRLDQNQSFKLYEGTTEVNYNNDGTLTLQIRNISSMINGTPTIAIDIPLEKISNGNIKVNNIWKKCWIWKKISGSWKRCLIWKKISGIWKKGI